MCELSVRSTAIGTNKGPEICAHILWSQIVAVDAPLVGGQLEQPAYDPLVPLVLLHPARHRRRRTLTREKKKHHPKKSPTKPPEWPEIRRNPGQIRPPTTTDQPTRSPHPREPSSARARDPARAKEGRGEAEPRRRGGGGNGK